MNKSGSTKVYPADHLIGTGFWFWYKKAVMPKKKVIAARKDWTNFTTQSNENKKIK